MNCKFIKNNTLNFLENKLSSKEQGSFKMHLEKCSSCAVYVEEIKLIWNLFDKKTEAVVDPFFFNKLEHRLPKPETKDISLLQTIFAMYFKPALTIIIVTLSIASGIILGGSFSNLLATNSNESINYKTYRETLYFSDLENEPIESFLLTQTEN